MIYYPPNLQFHMVFPLFDNIFFFLLNFLLFQHHFYKLSFFMTHSGIHLFPITLLRNLRHLFVTSGKTDSKNSLLFLQLQLKKKKTFIVFFSVQKYAIALRQDNLLWIVRLSTKCCCRLLLSCYCCSSLLSTRKSCCLQFFLLLLIS